MPYPAAAEASPKALKLLHEVWSDIRHDLHQEVLVFPTRIIWLNGAPGSGKGTNTRIIQRVAGIAASPVVVSDLLTTPEFIRIKNSGALVGDREVIDLLLERILDPIFHAGVIIDGFPRSPVQAEFLRRLHERLMELHRSAAGTFPATRFELVLLDVSEPVAIERQLKRGREALAANERSRKVGDGRIEEIRATDIDPAAADRRYRVFQEQAVDALRSLANVFPCYRIDAGGDIPTVARSIEKAFAAPA